MKCTSSISCLAVPANLGALLSFMDASCKEANLDEEACFALRLAGEEVCSNIIEHAYNGMQPGPISIRFSRDAHRAVLVVEDQAPVFDPIDAPPPNLSPDWQNRQPGGLGWHLVHQMMHEVRHQVLDSGGNRIELVRLLD